ncbi:MAG: enolase C-terminal domain-like protein [Solirubrobacterales bacterium]
MKVTAVRCIEVTGTIHDPEIYWDDQLVRPTDLYPELLEGTAEMRPPADRRQPFPVRSIFVRIDAEDGSYGTAGPITPAQAWLIRRRLRPLLEGADALATERLWEVMYRSCVAHGRKGLEMLAISVVDCALWDLKGKHFGVPVWRLLGGPLRDRIPVYASTLGSSHEPGMVKELAERLKSEGFCGMKWFPRFGPKDGREGMRRNVELVHQLREAVGDAMLLMIDAWMSWDVRYTIEFARRVADYDLHWIEEPVLPDRLDSYAELSARIGTQVRIAGGEHEYTRWGMQQLAGQGGVQVLQPDGHWAGGLSELVKIAAIASAQEVELVPHGGPVAANAHLTFAQPEPLVPMAEYLFRQKIVYEWFLADPVGPIDGFIDPPSRPGLGIELDESKIESRRELRDD